MDSYNGLESLISPGQVLPNWNSTFFRAEFASSSHVQPFNEHSSNQKDFLQADATMHLPAQIGDYTDFYTCEEHARNATAILRTGVRILLPNWYNSAYQSLFRRSVSRLLLYLQYNQSLKSLNSRYCKYCRLIPVYVVSAESHEENTQVTLLFPFLGKENRRERQCLILHTTKFLIGTIAVGCQVEKKSRYNGKDRYLQALNLESTFQIYLFCKRVPYWYLATDGHGWLSSCHQIMS